MIYFMKSFSKQFIRVVFLFWGFMIFYSCNNSKKENKEIQLVIEVIDSENYGEVRLQKVNSDYSIELIKSDEIIDKKLEFDLFIDEATLFRLDFMGKSSIDLIINDSDVKILIDDSKSLFKYEIQGSSDTNILRSITNKITNYRSEIRELNEQFINASEEQNIQLINSVREEFSFRKNQFELSLKDYLGSVDISLAVLITSDYLSIDENIIFWESIYDKYYNKLKYNSYFINFENKLKKTKSVSVGSIAPEIILNDPNGDPISLSSLRGNYVLLDFWAALCRPFREENPNILENYYKFKDKGFEVYQVSLERNKDDWARGIKDDKLPWINVSDLKYYQSEAAILYNVYKIPSAFLLDPEGRIIAKDLELRGRNLSNKLDEVFNQK